MCRNRCPADLETMEPVAPGDLLGSITSSNLLIIVLWHARWEEDMMVQVVQISSHHGEGKALLRSMYRVVRAKLFQEESLSFNFLVRSLRTSSRGEVVRLSEVMIDWMN